MSSGSPKIVMTAVEKCAVKEGIFITIDCDRSVQWLQLQQMLFVGLVSHMPAYGTRNTNVSQAYMIHRTARHYFLVGVCSISLIGEEGTHHNYHTNTHIPGHSFHAVL